MYFQQSKRLTIQKNHSYLLKKKNSNNFIFIQMTLIHNLTYSLQLAHLSYVSDATGDLVFQSHECYIC